MEIHFTEFLSSSNVNFYKIAWNIYLKTFSRLENSKVGTNLLFFAKSTKPDRQVLLTVS
jgi:hypothetical protein